MRERQSAHLHLEQPECLMVEYPARLRSEANRSGSQHWTDTSKRAKAHRRQARLMLHASHGMGTQLCAESYVIRITRIAPRKLDPDNLGRAAKAVQDGVADWLGIDDGNDRLTWDYDQDKAAESKTYAVRIEVFPDGCVGCKARKVIRGRRHEAPCPVCNGLGVEAA